MKLQNRIEKSPFWKSVITLSSGKIISQVLNIFSIPVISRIYSRNSFGDFGLITSTATIIIGFIGMGLGSAIMVPDTIEESEKIFRTTYYIQIILTVLFSTVLLFLKPFYQIHSVSIPYTISLLVMFLYISLNVLLSLLNVLINRMQLNEVLFKNSLLHSFINIGITIFLGVAGFEVFGLYVASIVTLLISNAYLLSKRNPFKMNSSIDEAKFVLSKYRRFIIYQYPANLVGTFSGQLPNQFLARSFGTTALGDFTMSLKVFGLPLSLIAAPIQTVYFRMVSNMYRDGEDIAGFTFSLLKWLLLLSVVPLVLLIRYGEILFTLVLGSQWQIAGKIASILAFQYVFSFLYSCITYCRVAIQKQKVNLFTSITQIIIILSSLVVGVIIFRTFIATIICFAIANTVFGVFNIAVTFWTLGKYMLKFILMAVLYLTICTVLVLV